MLALFSTYLHCRYKPIVFIKNDSNIGLPIIKHF